MPKTIITIFSIIIFVPNLVLGQSKNFELAQFDQKIEFLTKRVQVIEGQLEELQHKLSTCKCLNQQGISESNLEDSKVKIYEDAKKKYNAALALLKNSDFKEAEEKFTQIINNPQDEGVTAKAIFWLGESFYRQKSYNKAAIQFLKCYKAAPKGSKAADSLLKLALALSHLDKKNEACNIVSKLEKEFAEDNNNAIKRAAILKSKIKCTNLTKE